MQAIEIKDFGGPDALRSCERDTPTITAGDVLIDVAYAGVNRPDVVQRKGMYPPPKGASDIPGLEVSGTITAVGKGVDGWSVGDKVLALVTGGGYANQCVAPAETLLPIPKGLSLAEAAALPENYFTVWSNVFDRGLLKKGETLLVHGGSSGIGSTAIQMAKAFGATVITTAGSAEKCAFCHDIGADIAVNYREEDYAEAALKATNGKGVDVVLDMVGGGYIAKNISVMAVGGRHVSIAFLNGPKVEMNMLPVMVKRLTLTGSTLRARDNAFKGAIAANLREHVWPHIESGAITPKIYKTFALGDAAAAHALMESSDHMGKILLEI